jgi:hypothetical protein
MSKTFAKIFLGIVFIAVLTLGIFTALGTRSRNTSQLSTATTVTPLASPVQAPTQSAYPLPSTPTPIPLVVVSPVATVIINLTPPATSRPPQPCCTPQPTSISAGEQLRQTLMRFSPEKRLIIDQDTIAVIGTRGDPHNLTETRDNLVIAPHHIPSLSVININLSGTVVSQDYKSAEGQRYLESLVANPQTMETLKTFLANYASKLTK